MSYEYSGYLGSLLHAPDLDAIAQAGAIALNAEQIAEWRTEDDPAEPEWTNIGAFITRNGDVVSLHGDFEEVRRIDDLDEDDPSFWVPLSSQKWTKGPFPIDLARYPVIEITYRCATPHARPAWLWHYPGGVHKDGLRPAREWRTIARLAQHGGFPQQIDAITLRLYSVARSEEVLEIKSIRFRALTHAEAMALAAQAPALEETGPPRNYPLLDHFFPMGVYMKAGAAKRLAQAMETSFRDYWRLALEDVARYHHNTVVLEEIETLSPVEWRELLGLAVSFGIRILPVHDWPLDQPKLDLEVLIRTHIAPHAESPAILAWCIKDEPAEHTFRTHLQARWLIERADPNHPLAILLREPNVCPLFAPYFSAISIAHFRSGAAWDLGPMVRAHAALHRGQQFWVNAPAFVYATDTPLWNTCPEIRLMLNLAFANGARGWLSFCYHNEPIWAGGDFLRSLTGPFLTFSDVWAELGTRMERFAGLAPLFLKAKPAGAQEVGFEITANKHELAKLPPNTEPIQWHWLQAPDYALIYIINNDIGEVTPVTVKVPAHLPKGLEIYDMTEFVRSLKWEPMPRDRHLEMFPGQGQVLLLAEPEVCARLRDEVTAALIAGDRRQIALDLSLARRYHRDVREVRDLTQRVGMDDPLQDVNRTLQARAYLVNLLYRTPAVYQTRSKLIQASAAICGADGALCRLLGMGKSNLAHDLGLKLIPLTGELTRLRLELRRGRGPEAYEPAARLAEKCVKLLEDIRRHAAARET